MRFRLRTLLIVLALGPPLIAAGWWGSREWRDSQVEQVWVGGGGRMTIYKVRDGKRMIIEEFNYNTGRSGPATDNRP
jgi:hypothetical protein